MGDRIAVLKDGLLQQVGTPRDLYEAPANAFVAGFIGSPAMNLFPADIVDGGVQFGTATVKVDRETLAGASGKRVTVGIRPEDLTVSSSGKGLQATVDLVEELGADGYLYGSAEVNGEKIEMVVRVDGRDHPVAGDKIPCCQSSTTCTCLTRQPVFDSPKKPFLPIPRNLVVCGCHPVATTHRSGGHAHEFVTLDYLLRGQYRIVRAALGVAAGAMAG
jgi:ABC-type sugar transport system ATPase subunit